MEKRIVRVFVGNLPLDTVEEDVKSIMKNYASVVSVEIKKRTDVLFAFVNLENLKIDLDTCLEKLSLKKWKGHQLCVQKAQESFLQRLQRERENNEDISVKDTHFPSKKEKKNDHTNKFLKSNCQNNNDITNKDIFKEKRDNQFVSSDEDDSEIPQKNGVPMFLGTKAVFQNEKAVRQESSKINSKKISANKIHEEKEILGKFEMFDSVWKDEPSDVRQNTSKREIEIKVRNPRKDYSFSNSWNMKDKDANEPPCTEMQKAITLIKQEEAEKRRKKALEDRQKELLKRKHVVKFALASVDSINGTSKPNKRIFFSDDELIEGNDKNCSQNKDEKLKLFSDEEMECEPNNDNDFRIRKHYEGERGQSLLALQARYGNDRRFTLDERFFEDEGNEEETKGEIDDTQVERQNVLRILGSVLGKVVSNREKTKPKHSTKLMLRYDPTKPDHEKFEIKQESCSQKSSKSVQTSTAAIKNLHEKPTDDLPVVSKERYYEVTDKLMDSLQNPDKKFSLLEMFGYENETEDANIELDAKPITKKKNEWSLNPFKDDSGNSEDETFLQRMVTDNDNSTKIGVRQESLFFSKNDARFMEGLEFISHTNEKYMKNFNSIRNNIKLIVKRKILTARRKEGIRKMKFGGGRTKSGGSKYKPKEQHSRII